MRSNSLKSCFFVLCLLLGASHAAIAQGIAKGAFELSANGGITNLSGIDNKDGHGTFGFAGAYNVTNHLAVIGEYNYLMLGSLSQAGITGNEHLQTYGAAARVSLLNTRLVVPYVVLGAGGNHATASASSGNLTASASRSGGYFSTGGGVSVYAGHGFGIRPEFRYERQQFPASTINGIAVSGGGQNELRATVALFYQFGGASRRHV